MTHHEPETPQPTLGDKVASLALGLVLALYALVVVARPLYDLWMGY